MHKNAQHGYGLLTGLNNVELGSMNNIELASMNNVELAGMNNIQLASMNSFVDNVVQAW